jgi:hypothetical protein
MDVPAQHKPFPVLYGSLNIPESNNDLVKTNLQNQNKCYNINKKKASLVRSNFNFFLWLLLLLYVFGQILWVG